VLKSVHHVPEHLSTMSPDRTPWKGEGEKRPLIHFEAHLSASPGKGITEQLKTYLNV